MLRNIILCWSVLVTMCRQLTQRRYVIMKWPVLEPATSYTTLLQCCYSGVSILCPGGDGAFDAIWWLVQTSKTSRERCCSASASVIINISVIINTFINKDVAVAHTKYMQIKTECWVHKKLKYTHTKIVSAYQRNHPQQLIIRHLFNI